MPLKVVAAADIASGIAVRWRSMRITVLLIPSAKGRLTSSSGSLKVHFFIL